MKEQQYKDDLKTLDTMIEELKVARTPTNKEAEMVRSRIACLERMKVFTKAQMELSRRAIDSQGGLF